MGSIDQRVNVGVGVVVRNSDNEVLLGKRIGGKHGDQTFSFPGGKPDPGEHPALAAVRELYEETGLIAYGLTNLEKWTYDRFEEDGIHYITLYFECYAEGQPVNREPDKHESWEWYGEDQLPSPLFCGLRAALGLD